jgi:tetratricopeptide (TPR) repeat protein
VQALDRGEQDRGVELLQQAIQANPGLITPRSILGEIYRKQNQYELALTQYQTLVGLDAYTPANHYYLGLTYQFMDRLREAAAAYMAALKLNPDDPKSNMNLGLVGLVLGNGDDAVSHIERATMLDPTSASAFANLGVALDSRGEYGRAESAYRRSLELDSSQPSTVTNLGANLIAQKKVSEAISMLEQAIKMEDTPRAHKLLGDALALAKRYDDALKQYDVALTKNSNYAPALNGRAAVLIQKYQAGSQLDDTLRAAAVKSWQQSLSANANQPQVSAAIKQWEKQPMLNK